MAARGMVVFAEDFCKGCGLCVEFCPQHCLAMAADRFNIKGYRPAEVVAPEKCTGCATCALVCPDVVITVYRERRQAAVRPQAVDAPVEAAGGVG